MSSWYYADANNARQGPVDGTDMVRWLGEGRLRWETLVWREGMGEWQPMSAFAEEFTALAASAAPVATAAAETARAAATDTAAPGSWTTASTTTPEADSRAMAPGLSSTRAEDVRWSPATPTAATTSDSPYAAPSAPLLQAAGVYQGNEVVYAGFWKRMAAYMIDALIVSIGTYAVQLPLLFLSFGSLDMSTPRPGMGVVVVMAYLLPLLMQMVYFAWFHASGRQATPGKMAIGIKVTSETGERISFLRGVGRYFGTIVSSVILLIGYLMAGLTERKQALHDMMSSTLVVDKWAYTAHPEWQRRELGTITVVILVLGGLLTAAGIAAVVLGLMALGGALGR